MTQRTEILLMGIGLLLAGSAYLVWYKRLARRYAEQMKNNPFTKWFRFEYSEEYYRKFNVFGGLFMIASGILCLVSAIGGEPGRVLHSVERYIVLALVALIFGGGFIFIIYINWRFGIRRKK